MALIDGSPGLIFVRGGRLLRVLKLSFKHGKIAEAEAIADPEQLRQLDLAVP